MNAARHFVARYLPIIVITLTNLGLAWMLLGCASGPVHVAPATTTSFAEMMMAEETANARRAAHSMRQTVRGGSSGKARVLDNSKLPEAYTQKGKLTVWPSQFHLAYAARTLVRAYYAATRPVHQELESGELVEVVDEAGGNLYVLDEIVKDCELDIADTQDRRLFELVPPGQSERSVGNKKVGWLLRVINDAMLGVPTFDENVDLQWRVYFRREDWHTRKSAHLIGQTVDDA